MQREITKNGVVELMGEDGKKILDMVCEKNHSTDLHYLAFDRQISGFSPLGTFVLMNKNIRSNEEEILKRLEISGECVSLYPEEKLTLYPMHRTESGYVVDLEEIDKHFTDILKLNDQVYKTKILCVDFGHGAENMDEKLVITKLQNLLGESSILEKIYLIER